MRFVGERLSIAADDEGILDGPLEIRILTQFLLEPFGRLLGPGIPFALFEHDIFLGGIDFEGGADFARGVDLGIRIAFETGGVFGEGFR